MKLIFTVGMATAASALAIPGPVQRPDIPVNVGPITGTDEVAALSIAIPGPIQSPDAPVDVGPITGTDDEIVAAAIAIPGPVQRPDVPVGVGPITGTDEVTPLAATRVIQPTDEDWYTALRDPTPGPILTRRGWFGRKKKLADEEAAWLNGILDNVDIDSEEDQADEDSRMREFLENQRGPGESLVELSERLRDLGQKYDEDLDLELELAEEEDRIKEDNESWHKRRGKALKRKLRLTKLFDFLDRLLTWIWVVKGAE